LVAACQPDELFPAPGFTEEDVADCHAAADKDLVSAADEAVGLGGGMSHLSRTIISDKGGYNDARI
jgi:hypothetical protein